MQVNNFGYFKDNSGSGFGVFGFQALQAWRPLIVITITI